MFPFRAGEDWLEWRRNAETLRVEAWGESSLRVRARPGQGVVDGLPGALESRPPGKAEVAVGSGGATVRSGCLLVKVTPEGQLTFSDNDGKVLLGEPSPHFARPPARWFRPGAGESRRVECRFSARPGERLYGLGQHQHGRLDQSGLVIDLIQRNMEVSIPFLVSSRGYGLLWNHPGIGRVELAGSQTRWVADSLRQIDYWVTAGRTPAAIIERYVELTGRPPLLPKWATGFWQSKLRYATQSEVVDIARGYRERGLPLSAMVIDFFHWPRMGDWRFEPEEWPDPAAMVTELRSMGVEPVVSIWPTVNPESANYQPMAERGLLIATESGLAALSEGWDRGRARGVPVYLGCYDATNPEARAYLWRQIVHGYHRHGIRAWWLDACEPELRPEQPENLRYELGPGMEVQNLYPVLHARGFAEGMQEAGEGTVLLCRSAWAGSQRWGVAVWSGDIDSTFEALAAQVPAGLNMALSGIPWWTTDIGGFRGGDVNSPSFRELIVRWFQYAAFCPLFRLHGHRKPSPEVRCGPTGAGNEVWSFGDDCYGLIREVLWLRERLRPYVMAQMGVAHDRGTPPMRPLLWDFPGDARAWEIADEFMLGPDLLVAPITAEGARRRCAYVPEGDWLEAWSGHTSPTGEVEVEAPLDRIPVWVRRGSGLDAVIRGG